MPVNEIVFPAIDVDPVHGRRFVTDARSVGGVEIDVDARRKVGRDLRLCASASSVLYTACAVAASAACATTTSITLTV